MTRAEILDTIVEAFYMEIAPDNMFYFKHLGILRETLDGYRVSVETSGYVRKLWIHYRQADGKKTVECIAKRAEIERRHHWNTCAKIQIDDIRERFQAHEREERETLMPESQTIDDLWGEL